MSVIRRALGKINPHSLLLTMTSQMHSNARPKVFVTRNDFPQKGIDLLKSSCEVEEWDVAQGNCPRNVFLEKSKGCSALYVKSGDLIDKELLDAAGNSLKVVGTMSVGVDHVDLTALKEKGVKLGYTPDVLTEATAELALGLLLATSRRLFEAHNEMTSGGWKSWAPLWMCGQGLEGSTVGIFGFGRIGQSIARKVIAFQAKVLYSSAQDKPEGVKMGAERTSLEDMLRRSDFIVLSSALSERTKGFFNKDKFSMMKPNCILVNISRGGVVNQEDLIKALKTGQIAAAGLDVMTPEPLPTDHELHSLKNCVLLPHIGSATYHAREEMSLLTAENILAGIKGSYMPAEYIA